MTAINEISSKIKYYEIFLSNSSEVILKINKIGMSQILFNGWINNLYPCPSLIYLNNEIQNLMDCTRIKIDIPESFVKLIWNNPIISSKCLFCYCSNIAEIKFLNFDTSLITHSGGLFEHCYSLTSVDISKLNTSNIMDINRLFYDCKNLIYIDLSNFDTSKITDMHELFYNCEKLEYINLLNFTDNKSPSITNMFYGISKNPVICIDKNKAPSIYNLANNMPCVSISCIPNWLDVQYKISETGECIINCSSIINRYEYNGKCYDKCDSNCKTCYFKDNIPSSNCSSCYKNKFLKNGKCVDSCKNGYSYYNSNDKINYCTPDYSCPKNFNKLISIKNQCIDDCTKDSNYPYEFRHTCYQECPHNISER